jgi:hypothetical protein
VLWPYSLPQPEARPDEQSRLSFRGSPRSYTESFLILRHLFNRLQQNVKGRLDRHRVLRALAMGVMVGVGMALFVPLIADGSELLVSLIAGIGITFVMLFLD